MSRSYPYVSERVDIRDAQARRQPAHKKQCAVCSVEATHAACVQVNWFRGDDVTLYACAKHIRDAALTEVA